MECVLAKLEGNRSSYYEDVQKIFELAQNVDSLYVKGNLEQKAGIAKILTSNCTVNDVNLSPKYRKPFNYIAEGLLCTEKLPREGSNLGQAR